MITVFNDAKRTSLSGWSWPSRFVAEKLGDSFRTLGITSGRGNIDAKYVTPTNHSIFLNCIVRSHIGTVVESLREALAVSLRLDGSVDRTAEHNVYVMGHIIHKDTTVSTLFIGFDVPKNGDVAGYLQCLEEIITKVLPWDDFFELITSLVTDGEGLNMGRINGLAQQLIRKRLNNTTSLLPFLALWCIAHRINLAWKALCKLNIVANLIAACARLSAHFRKSGAKTKKLKTAAATHNLDKPLRYPRYFEIRWVEFVHNLFYAVLRNWRASNTYFEMENLQIMANRWLNYDNIRLLAFLTDVIDILKAYQKFCQSDTISILDALEKLDRLFDKLQRCKRGPVDGGWEALLLASVATNGNTVSLHGFRLKTNSSTSRTRRQPNSFSSAKRDLIITTLIKHLKIRLSLDDDLRSALKPLLKLNSSISQQDLDKCHSYIIPDKDKQTFSVEYSVAADKLKDFDCESPIISLQKLHEIQPDDFATLKVALARVAVLKPHSADVERLISWNAKLQSWVVTDHYQFIFVPDFYNKFKSPDRPLSSDSLFNYLYVNTNMGCLEDFNPAPAVQYWLNDKIRRPSASTMNHTQEWFRGVFNAADDKERITNKRVVKF